MKKNKKIDVVEMEKIDENNKLKIINLSAEELDFLFDFFSMNNGTITNAEQKTILKIYNKLFGKKRKPTQCVICWIEMLYEIKIFLKLK